MAISIFYLIKTKVKYIKSLKSVLFEDKNNYNQLRMGFMGIAETFVFEELERHGGLVALSHRAPPLAPRRLYD